MISFKCPGGVYNAMPGRVLFGRGSLKNIAGEVEHLGGKKALVISTPGRKAMAERAAALIGGHCIGILPDAVSQVPIELAVKGRKKAREIGADCLVAIGGGASVGLAKGIAYEVKLPIINIATTYSGSEVTGFCGMTINGVKQMHISLNMLASTLIYDPELTLSLPAKVSAASAMNALAHCVDAVYVSTVNPVVAIAAAEGAKHIFEAAPAVVAVPGDIGARERLLFGSYLAGIALTGGFALQHGLAHVLGGTFHIEHGLAHSLVLPYVAAFHAHRVPAALVPIANALKSDVSDLGGAIYDMRAKLGLPKSLREIGFDRKDLQTLVTITIETDNGYNPVPVSEEAVSEIVGQMWNGDRPQR